MESTVTLCATGCSEPTKKMKNSSNACTPRAEPDALKYASTGAASLLPMFYTIVPLYRNTLVTTKPRRCSQLLLVQIKAGFR